MIKLEGRKRMIKGFFNKILHKRKMASTMTNYLILSKEDIEKLLNGRVITFEVDELKVIQSIAVITEEKYEQLLSEVKGESL